MRCLGNEKYFVRCGGLSPLPREGPKRLLPPPPLEFLLLPQQSGPPLQLYFSRASCPPLSLGTCPPSRLGNASLFRRPGAGLTSGPSMGRSCNSIGALSRILVRGLAAVGQKVQHERGPREEGTQLRGPRSQTQMRGWNSRPERRDSGRSWVQE